MLGWSVNIKREGRDQETVAYWEANLMLMDIENHPDTEVLEFHGGYPNIYRVSLSLVRELLDGSNDFKNASPTWLYKDRIKWIKTIPETLSDEFYTMEIWDQS